MGHAALFHRRVDRPAGKPDASRNSAGEITLLQHALECVSEGVAITASRSGNGRARILHANPSFHELLDRLEADSGDRRPAAAGRDNPLWLSLGESHRGDAPYSTEIDARCRDGSPILLHFRSQPFTRGRTAYRVAVVRDLTEKRLAEESIRRNERLASIGLLGAGIAHEISNPVGSALLAAETALEVKNSPEDGKQCEACLRNIIASMDRCGRIVRTLLRYSRREPTEKLACDINDVVEQVIDQARPYAASHGAEFRADLDPDVPLARMNPLEIELVLLNLVRNAVEAGRDGTVIALRTARIEGEVRIEVADDGRGMNEEQLARVFDPFYTTRRAAGGSGVGMSIAKGIVQGHEGRMEARSLPGKGTTVIVELPVAAGALPG